MKQGSVKLLAIAGAAMGLAACNQTRTENAAMEKKTEAKSETNDPIASAMSAAPDVVARDATIAAVNADGSTKVLREGKNGWTCMPDNPATPGTDPMCGDSNAMKWAAAWIGHKPPPANTVGVMYMLRGGTDASNTDPYAQKPTAQNNWIETGPHIMVVGSADVLKGHPAMPQPDTKAPYVMWPGTAYAHLMVPVG